jgi:uncharacterized membrane protein YraQ (UPF0718 family)
MHLRPRRFAKALGQHYHPVVELILESLRQSWLLLLQSGPYLLLGFALAGLLHVLLPVQQLSYWLGGATWKPVFRAALIGVPLPLCSCSVVPVAASLRRAGASRGATSAFLISTPESGVDSIAATWALLDPVMTVARPLSAFFTAFTAGLFQNLWDRRTPEHATEPDPLSQTESHAPPALPAAASCCSHDAAPVPAAAAAATASCCSHAAPVALSASRPAKADPSGHCHASGTSAGAEAQAPTRLRGMSLVWARLARGLRYSLVEMFEDLGRYMILGFLLAGVLTVLLNQYLPLRSALGSPWAPFIMLVAGAPVYVCAASATPLIAVLISQGLSPGAGLIFLLAGPATNAASVVLLRQLIGYRGVVVYLVSIVVCALVAGYAVDAAYDVLGLAPQALVRAEACHAAPSWVDAGAALLLLACMVNGTVRRYVKRMLARVQTEAHRRAVRA